MLRQLLQYARIPWKRTHEYEAVPPCIVAKARTEEIAIVATISVETDRRRCRNDMVAEEILAVLVGGRLQVHDGKGHKAGV